MAMIISGIPNNLKMLKIISEVLLFQVPLINGNTPPIITTIPAYIGPQLGIILTNVTIWSTGMVDFPPIEIGIKNINIPKAANKTNLTMSADVYLTLFSAIVSLLLNFYSFFLFNTNYKIYALIF